MYKQIVKDTSLMGAGTFLSRVFGFIRDILIAAFFGTSAGVEAFFVAFKIPNLFRSIFAEGFSDSVATPVLSSYREDKKKVLGVSQDLIAALSVFLLIFTLIGVVFARYFVILVAPGFLTETFKFNLAVSFTRLTFFYLFFIGLTSNFIAVLYVHKKFFIPAVSPLFLNLSFIAGILFFGRNLGVQVLVYSVLVGGVLQLLFSFIALRRKGFKLHLNFKKAIANSRVLKIFKLFLGRLFASIIYELSVIVDTIFSSLTFIVGQGALASIYYANRLIQLPFAIIILSLTRVVTVDLSFYGKDKNHNKFKELLIFSFQNLIFFILPVSALFLFISVPIVEVIFNRGEFGADSLRLTSSALFFYSFGLFFFCAVKLLVNSFYSLTDTKTPAKIAALVLLVNIILSGVLIFPLKIGGLALGSSLAAMLNFFLLYFSLQKKIGSIGLSVLKPYFLKVLFLSLAYGFLSRWLWMFGFNRYAKISLILAVGIVIFGLGGYLLRLKQINLFWQWIFRKN